MSSRNWQQRVEDIIAAIADIQQWTSDKTPQHLESDPILLRAVLYSFLIIGEASMSIPSDLQDRYPDIPWRLMKDMRNIMAHEYFQIDVLILWRTIQRSLPSVLPKLEELLAAEVSNE